MLKLTFSKLLKADLTKINPERAWWWQKIILLAITVYALQRENTVHKALAGIVKKGTKAIKAWIEPTDWMRGLHRHMVPGRGGASCLMPILQGKHGSHIYVAGVTCTSLTSRIPKIPWLQHKAGWMLQEVIPCPNFNNKTPPKHSSNYKQWRGKLEL